MDRFSDSISGNLLRSWRRVSTLVVAILVMSMFWPISSQAASFGETLNIAISSDMGSPDPATYYGNEGLSIMDALYEGLLQYAPVSPEKNSIPNPLIVPQAASSVTSSKDGLTYTAKLKAGMKFHDGTPVNSAAAKSSFERFSNVKGGPSYMLADVDSYSTPDDLTFVIKLKRPVDPFLTFLASCWGPKLMSPATLKKHVLKDDFGQDWIKTHDAGSGPYQIKTWSSRGYVLEAAPNYYGNKPFFKSVSIAIVPSFTTQQLMMSQNKLDLILNGLLPRDLKTITKQGNKTFVYPINMVQGIFINSSNGIFADAAIRKALANAIDRKKLVSTVYGDTGSLALTISPVVGLPKGTTTYNPKYDPNLLKKAISTLPASDRKVVIAFQTQDAVARQMNNLVSGNLSKIGLKVTSVGVTWDQASVYGAKPELRPDMFISQSVADTTNPFAFYSLFLQKSGGLSYMSSDSCLKADAIVNDAYSQSTPAAASKKYIAADAGYAACGVYIPMADTNGLLAYRNGLSGVEHAFATQTSTRLALIRVN